MENVIQNILLEDIVPNNYKEQYNMNEIEELATSIKIHGVLEPIIVRPKDNKYELIIGNKRYHASIIAGKKTIPAIIRQLDDNKANEYKIIDNKVLLRNDNKKDNSIQTNLDIVNLSKLNQEYERDDFKMNNNQFENNNMIQQPMQNIQPEPTFGGRFFPSLEDEPTNMNFGMNNFGVNNMEHTVLQPTPQPQTTNNFIDLTDLNMNQGPMQQPTPNNFVETPVTNPIEQPNMNNNIIPDVQNIVPDFSTNTSFIQNTMEPTPNTGNIINLDSLKQNQELGVQPIQEPINIDNNFQEVMSDFGANTSFMPNAMEQTLANTPNFETLNQNIDINPTPINQEIDNNYNMNQNLEIPNANMNPAIDNNYNMNQSFIPNIEEPINYNNISYNEPTIQEPIQEIVVPNTNIEPMISNNNLVETQSIEQKKDVMPVINTLKALAVNLENFGYKIRITDEDGATSYKITIEVDK